MDHRKITIFSLILFWFENFFFTDDIYVLRESLRLRKILWLSFILTGFVGELWISLGWICRSVGFWLLLFLFYLVHGKYPFRELYNLLNREFSFSYRRIFSLLRIPQIYRLLTLRHAIMFNFLFFNRFYLVCKPQLLEINLRFSQGRCYFLRERYFFVRRTFVGKVLWFNFLICLAFVFDECTLWWMIFLSLFLRFKLWQFIFLWHKIAFLIIFVFLFILLKMRIIYFEFYEVHIVWLVRVFIKIISHE